MTELLWVERREGTDAAAAEACAEAMKASESFPAFHSAHEGYAVISEEMDELWELVKQKPALRSRPLMRLEAMQIAAMAIRFMVDCT